MKVFITKYALTQGIKELDVAIKTSTAYKKGCYVYSVKEGGFFNDDFHFTEKEAIADAEKKRIKKIESHKKQITKLENLSFKII